MLIAATVIVWTKPPPLDAIYRYGTGGLAALYLVMAGPGLWRDLRANGQAGNDASAGANKGGGNRKRGKKR
jgi:hypothetical protein